MNTFLLKMNLQLFADDEGFGNYDPMSAYDGIEIPESSEQPNFEQPNFEQPNFDEEEYEEEEYDEEGYEEEEYEEESYLDFGGRRLPANEELSGLHKDFTEQQRYITALQEQVNAYKQIATMQQPEVNQAPEPQISSDTAEWDEDTWQKFYDNPNEVMGNLINNQVQQIVAEKIDPIIQEREWNNNIQELNDTYPDFEEFIPEIQELVTQFPERYADRPDGLEEAYYRAKSEKMSDPSSLLQDEQFLNDYVLSNQAVQQQFLNQYFSQKQNTNQRVPSVMGRQQGGFTAQAPDSAPQTLKQASQAFLKQLGVR